MSKSFAEELEMLKAQGLHRKMRRIAGSQGSRVVVDGKESLLLCSNNYLGLAGHPRLAEASISAVERYGTSSGASRLVSGNMELHALLEERIARFKGTEAALVFNSGYAANSGIIPALVGKGDVVFSDRLNHASIVDGCLLSRATMVRYPHNDIAALQRLLERHQTDGRRLIVTDGVFSMDGDLARLRELVGLKRKFGALLMVDDAHGTGVLGDTGRGSAEAQGVLESVDIHMGTLGKALGSFGAYAAASDEIVDYLSNCARSFIFSTSLPPAVLAASIAAIDLIDSPEGAALRQQLDRNVIFFREGLNAAGFDTMGSETQIVPLFVGGAEQAMAFTARLLDEGVFAQGIRPPTVPAGTCRLRCTLMATHTEEDLAGAIERMARIGRELEVV